MVDVSTWERSIDLRLEESFSPAIAREIKVEIKKKVNRRIRGGIHFETKPVQPSIDYWVHLHNVGDFVMDSDENQKTITLATIRFFANQLNPGDIRKIKFVIKITKSSNSNDLLAPNHDVLINVVRPRN